MLIQDSFQMSFTTCASFIVISCKDIFAVSILIFTGDAPLFSTITINGLKYVNLINSRRYNIFALSILIFMSDTPLFSTITINGLIYVNLIDLGQYNDVFKFLLQKSANMHN